MAQIIKQNKLAYYFRAILKKYSRSNNFQEEILKLEKRLSSSQIVAATKRIEYCNKLSQGQSFRGEHKIHDLKFPQTPKSYYFDTWEYARFFDENLPLNFVFGDVIEVPAVPSIVKSRPVSSDNQNSVLLNLDKARHFVWVKDDRKFSEKKNMLIGRGAVYQQHRHDFFEKYFAHPLCDLGQVNKIGGNADWIKPKITIEEHLAYKFILSLEGNDVATNLKWIMSSNSIAVMPKPKYETWFMEGLLEGGKHYIEIAEDYSDLEEKLSFYINNTAESEKIARNAKLWCKQFWDKNLEDYCSLKVLEKYFGLK